MNVLGVDFFLLLLVTHLRLSQRKDDTVEGWLKPFYCHNTLPATAYQLFWWLILFLEHQPPPWPGTYLLLVKTLLERRRPYMNSNFMITLLFIQRDNLSLPGIWTPVPPWNRVWSTGSTNGTPCFLFFITYFTISQNLSSNKICWWTEQRWTVEQWLYITWCVQDTCWSHSLGWQDHHRTSRADTAQTAPCIPKFWNLNLILWINFAPE